jgi:hypothetical protein
MGFFSDKLKQVKESAATKVVATGLTVGAAGVAGGCHGEYSVGDPNYVSPNTLYQPTYIPPQQYEEERQHHHHDGNGGPPTIIVVPPCPVEPPVQTQPPAKDPHKRINGGGNGGNTHPNHHAKR